MNRDKRQHLNIIFCGHVDSGKSTISGHLLHDMGLVDERELEVLRKKAATTQGTGNCFSFIQDISEEEMRRGKTFEVSSSYFETETKRFTIMDAPGHKGLVNETLAGIVQSDVAVLVISARTGEFETGFEKQGQTKEHALLISVCGVKNMIVVVNKMDETKWDKLRYDEIVEKTTPFLKTLGYTEKSKNLIYMPISGMSGNGVSKKVEKNDCDWYDGFYLLEYLNQLELKEKEGDKSNEDLCVPLLGSYKDEFGKFYIYGKIESGKISVGEKLMILPTKKECIVDNIIIEQKEQKNISEAFTGDNIHIKIKNLDERDIMKGYVLTTQNQNQNQKRNFKEVNYFLAQVKILEIDNILSIGSKMVLHVHEANEEVSIHKIMAKIDPKTKEIIAREPSCIKSGEMAYIRFEVENKIVVAVQKEFDKMGRIILRMQGRTIAVGSIIKLYEKEI
jgi:peptide chain release factor subunit 3